MRYCSAIAWKAAHSLFRLSRSVMAFKIGEENNSERMPGDLKELFGISPLTAFLLPALIAIVVFKLVSKKKYRLPPGPKGLPIVGYVPFLGDVPHLSFSKLSEKYGNLISCYLGNKLIVVANDFTSVKEVLEKDEFLNRPEETILGAAFNNSLVTVNGQIWKEQRRFILHQLRDLGLGKSRLEEHIQEEISCFVRELVKYEGKPPNLRRLLSISTSNNIRFLVFGHRTDYDDPKSNEIEECNDRAESYFQKAQLEMFLPQWVTKLLHILGFDRMLEKMINEARIFRSLMAEETVEHKKTFQEDNIRDLVDGFLLEMNKRGHHEQSSFNDEFLLGNATALFAAGGSTTKTAISWLIVLMAKHQDVQQRAHDEIKEVIGKERMPNWSDHTSLPYCEAVIAETQRYRPIIPLNLERSPSGDSNVLGYDIPKNARIFTNIWAVHHDPSYWKDPEKFDPTRFLSKDGKKYIKSERVILFSAGRRSCPGETMANVEIFLYFVSMLQHFQIRTKEEDNIDIKGGYNFDTSSILLDKVRFQLRNE